MDINFCGTNFCNWDLKKVLFCEINFCESVMIDKNYGTNFWDFCVCFFLCKGMNKKCRKIVLMTVLLLEKKLRIIFFKVIRYFEHIVNGSSLHPYFPSQSSIDWVKKLLVPFWLAGITSNISFTSLIKRSTS